MKNNLIQVSLTVTLMLSTKITLALDNISSPELTKNQWQGIKQQIINDSYKKQTGNIKSSNQNFGTSPLFTQQAYIKASNTGSGDGFGFSIDISGDTMVVGGFREDGSPNGGGLDNDDISSGAVYVFVYDGLFWNQQAYIKSSNSEAGDEFGRAVSISGDTMVVTSFGEDSNANTINGDENNNLTADSGAAYVFTRTGTTWTQEAYIKPFNTGVEDRFGMSVALSGDILVVGASHEDSASTEINGNHLDNGAPDAGAAYIFRRTGTSWQQEAYLKASNTSPGDLFGLSVGVSGEVVIVGARGEDGSSTGVNSSDNNGATDAGAAYIFAMDAQGAWIQEAYIKASNTDNGDYFGQSVAISENTAVVGANREDGSDIGVNGDDSSNTAINSGAAYVFEYSQGVWSQQAYLKATNTDGGDEFGFDVDVHGNNIIVGARKEDSMPGAPEFDNSSTNSGAAYVYSRGSGNWQIDNGYIKGELGGAFDEFGYSVAISNGFIAVGADKEDSNAIGINMDPFNDDASNSGAAYIFQDTDLIFVNGFGTRE